MSCSVFPGTWRRADRGGADTDRGVLDAPHGGKNRSLLMHGVLGRARERWIESTLESQLAVLRAPADLGKERLVATRQHQVT